MMGYNHAISGATVWVAATTTVAGFGLIDVTPIGVITGAIVTAGAALLPDADHHNATIAHSAPIAGGIEYEIRPVVYGRTSYDGVYTTSTGYFSPDSQVFMQIVREYAKRLN